MTFRHRCRSLKLRPVTEDERVVAAIIAGDGDGAATAMRQHLQVVRRSVGDVAPTLRLGAVD